MVYSERKPRAAEAAERIRRFLEERGLRVKMLDARQAYGSGVPEGTETLIVLGGDGTLLRAVRALPSLKIPVLAVNYGRGGYLMEVEPERLEEALEALLGREYEVEEVMMLSFSAGGRGLGDALNEAYVSAASPGKVMELEVKRDESLLMRAVADGLVIATPIGSTAYAYSAGGPVVDEELRAAVLVPVCPISNVRSMVLALDSGFKVSASSEVGVQVLIDGHLREVFSEGRVELEVRRSENSVRFLRLRGEESFARRVWKRFR